MRISTLTLVLCLACNLCLIAQPPGFSVTKLDSLEKRLATLPNDTNRVNTLGEMATLYSNTNIEKSILLGEEALTLTRKLDYANGFRRILGPLSFQYSISGQWAKGLELALEGKERSKDNLYELSGYSGMAQLAYQFQGDYKRCLEECRENIQLFKSHPEVDFNLIDKWATYMSASQMYSELQHADSALIYAFKSLSYAQSIKINTVHYEGYAHSAIGFAYLAQDMPDSARSHLHIMRAAMEQINNQFALQETQITLAKVMQKKGALDSMYYYAKTAYDGALKMGNDINEMNAAFVLSDYFENINATKSLFYLKSYNAIKEKLFTQDQTNKRYFLESAQRNKVAELEKKEINTVNRIRQNTLLGILFTLALLAGVLILTNRNKKLLNDRLQQQKIKIENQNQDLVKSSHELAEKNRDLEIEAALERVRARTMSMQSSSELAEASHLLDQQVRSLGIETWGSAFHIYADNEAGDFEWFSSENGKMPFYKTPRENFFLRFYEKGQHGEIFHIEEFSGKACKDHYEYLMSIPFLGDALKAQVAAGISLPTSQIDHIAFFKHGYVLFITYKPVPEAHEVFQRFANVFEQTYTRFLDLQKAEAQAREAQIELAIERVRARAMVMHSSDELSQLVATLFEELVKLDLVLARCIIWIIDKETSSARVWMTNSEDTKSANSYFIKSLDHSYYKEIIKQWQERNPKWVYELKGDDKKSIDTLLLTETELSQLPEVVKQGIQSTQRTFISGSFNNFGLIEASGPVSHSEEQLEILHRFGKVFDQNYTRFLDLQKAETQTREAQIEAALEKIRSRSLAMHHSNELRDVIAVFFEKLIELGTLLGTVGIGLYDQKSKDISCWVGNAIQDPQLVVAPFDEAIMMEENFISQSWKAMTEKTEMVNVVYSREQKDRYFKHLFANNDLVQIPESAREILLKMEKHTVCFIPNHHSSLFVDSWNGKQYSDQDINILRRAGKVFEQAYTRFLDLQKAEAQAREAQIEAALERVRSKTMAMHNSNDVGESVATLFDELVNLGLLAAHDRCGIGIMQPNEAMEVWTAAKMEDGKAELTIGLLNMKTHPVLQGAYGGWEAKKESFQYVLEGEDKLNYYNAIRNQSNYKIKRDYFSEPVRIVHTDFYFNEGCLYVFSQNEISAESSMVFVRFAHVFGQTYRRYLDLQKAEAQAREAIKQSSIDRVRGVIASMRTTADLDRITPLIWKELTTLGIPFIRCGVFIMDENENKVHTYLSTPDGQAIAAYHIAMDNSGSLAGAIEHWRTRKVFVTHWVESDFQSQADLLLKQGSITSREQYLNSIPKEGFHLHFLPFRQGMLYVGSNEQLPADALQLVQSLADAFSVAYARYEDFTKLESAKTQIEKTLTDLKQTQTQLIQSEKMASLGELTAGIAHEIQNPLNFVNNFSEVSNELIKEIQDIRHKTQDQRIKSEEDEILNDIASNLEKINHHGKRAADIVKGMLQHSRSSSGVKEPSDINALADEYLRLAYHGLRAKDKSFNAKFETHLDPTLPNVNVIPQDIGRVILNLITNAFYAVNERQKLLATSNKLLANYEPTVSVSTRKEVNKVLISVKDNGNGIPQKILDKIFQPFFTTKPTGQGTGLGLSLSYDIVKSHGGELKVETLSAEAAAQAGNERVGSEFIISLPIKSGSI